MVVFLRSPFRCFSIDFHMARRLFQASGTFETITSKKMVLVGMETEKSAKCSYVVYYLTSTSFYYIRISERAKILHGIALKNRVEIRTES